MAGYPFSGKSYIVELITQKSTKDILVINPKEYRGNNYDNLSSLEKREVNLSAWETSLDALRVIIRETNNNDITIFDTACASADVMEGVFRDAKSAGHAVLLVYVNADIGVCEKRAGKERLSDDVMKKYETNIASSIKRLWKISDGKIIVDNNYNKEPDITVVLRYIS